MADLALETLDRFCALYDIVSLASEKAISEAEVGTELSLSRTAAEKIIQVMLSEGLMKISAGEQMRLTPQGFEFLQEFEGLRKFLG